MVHLVVAKVAVEVKSFQTLLLLVQEYFTFPFVQQKTTFLYYKKVCPFLRKFVAFPRK